MNVRNTATKEYGKKVTVRVQKVKKSHIKQKLVFFTVLAVCLVILAVFSDHLCPYDPYAQDLSSAFPMLDLCYVPGNCDYCTSVPASLLQEAGGVRIFLTHGHLFGVKTGLTRLLLEGKRVGAQLVLFGHTHRPYLAEHDGVWLLNPGSCSAMQGSYAVLTIENGGFHAELKEIG